MKQYTDNQFRKLKELIESIKLEHKSQLSKWGVQTHTLFEWLGYITEELGSLSKAISEYEYRNGRYDEIYKEAIQVATLALKIAEMIDEVSK